MKFDAKVTGFGLDIGSDLVLRFGFGWISLY